MYERLLYKKIIQFYDISINDLISFLGMAPSIYKIRHWNDWYIDIILYIPNNDNHLLTQLMFCTI